MNPLASQKKPWILTQDAFDQLLSAFAADRESAAQKYEIIRRKLSEFFEARGNDSPPDRVDETINRVARRIAEGEQIKDLNAYFYGVARLVCLENLRARDKEPTPLELAPTPVASHTVEVEAQQFQREQRLTCLETCLSRLPSTNRSLIVEYYREDKGIKIEHRKQQAARLNTTLNGLRLRASRIRSELAHCVHSCLERRPRTRNQSIDTD